MKIHETTMPDGSLVPTVLFSEGERVGVFAGDEKLLLPDGALEAVMQRYGLELDSAERLHEVASIVVAGHKVRHVRHLALYDVIARDFLVYESAGREPLCALAAPVSGALVHLGRAAQRSAASERDG